MGLQISRKIRVLDRITGNLYIRPSTGYSIGDGYGVRITGLGGTLQTYADQLVWRIEIGGNATITQSLNLNLSAKYEYSENYTNIGGTFGIKYVF